MELYGKYQPAEKYSGKRPDGTEYSGETLAGYSGDFRGSITDIDGNDVDDYSASQYFLTLRNPKNNTLKEDDMNFETWEIIDNYISNCVSEYMPECDHKYYHWQCRFGGNDLDGLVEFFCKEKVKILPPMIFKVYDKSYRMIWTYHAGYDDSEIE